MLNEENCVLNLPIQKENDNIRAIFCIQNRTWPLLTYKVFNYLLLILNLKNNKMKKLKFKFFVLSLVSIGILEADTASAQKQYFLPFDTSVVSNHKITINGSEIAYEVTVGTLPVYVEHKDEIPGKVTKPRA